MRTAKPFIKWVGGKSQLLEEIRSKYPSRIEKYCEPFTGGGVLVIRNIPCYKCETCDEIQFTGELVKNLKRLSLMQKKHIQELSVVNYATAA